MLRRTSINYKIVLTQRTSLTHFKLKSDLDNVDAYIEGYMLDNIDPELPYILESMGSEAKFISKFSNSPSLGVICNFYVDINNRGTGIGSELLETALNEFYTLNIDEVFLVANNRTDDYKILNGLEQWYKNRGFNTIALTNSIPLMTIKFNIIQKSLTT